MHYVLNEVAEDERHGAGNDHLQASNDDVLFRDATQERAQAKEAEHGNGCRGVVAIEDVASQGVRKKGSSTSSEASASYPWDSSTLQIRF
jgi:hypothetical protein